MDPISTYLCIVAQVLLDQTPLTFTLEHTFELFLRSFLTGKLTQAENTEQGGLLFGLGGDHSSLYKKSLV